MEPSTFRTILRDSVKLMILQQWDLCEYDVGERTVTSHLFRYMSEHELMPGRLRVDHEYNRHEGATKTIQSLTDDEGLDASGERRIYPDVILHRRGDDRENWLVIEAKRGNSCDDLDRMKIDALIKQYGYHSGVLLAFGMSARGWNPSWEWVSSDGGEPAEPLFDASALSDLNARGREAWKSRAIG